MGKLAGLLQDHFVTVLITSHSENWFLKECAIEHIHIFESRDMAFKDDDVLQENIIIKLTKGKQQSDVQISQSNDQTFRDYQSKIVPLLRSLNLMIQNYLSALRLTGNLKKKIIRFCRFIK